MLQILDDGYVTDASGIKINFRNTLIVMTSNIGVKKSQDFGSGLGFSTKATQNNDKERARTIISKALKDTFNPEFLNRLDDIIFFESLDDKSIKKIVGLELNNLVDRMSDKKYLVKFTQSVVNHVFEVGYDEKYGARPIKRAIQSEVEDYISEEILMNTIVEGGEYLISYDKSKETFTIEEKG